MNKENKGENPKLVVYIWYIRLLSHICWMYLRWHNKELKMPNKEFLEDYSLFRKYKADIPSTLDRLPKPPINMDCRDCGSVQTFNMINNYNEFKHYSNYPSDDQKVKAL